MARTCYPITHVIMEIRVPGERIHSGWQKFWTATTFFQNLSQNMEVAHEKPTDYKGGVIRHNSINYLMTFYRNNNQSSQYVWCDWCRPRAGTDISQRFISTKPFTASPL